MNISERIARVKKTILQAELDSQRQPGSVKLLAVSKGQSMDKIKEAYHGGLYEFGESYLQEAEKKIAALRHLGLQWHFIGSIQSNKAEAIARQFSWVHSVSRYTIAELLNRYRPADQAPLNICLQLNLTGESAKSGISARASFDLMEKLQAFSRLNCRGLMTMLHAHATEQEQYTLFTELRQLLQQLNQHFNVQMDTLSMGMSQDFIPAIHAGSTIIRLGEAVFGKREKRPSQ